MILTKPQKLILLIFFLGFLLGVLYLWAYYGYVKVSVNDDIVTFRIEPEKGTAIECHENPCLIKLRPGTNFTGIIQARDYLPRKVISDPVQFRQTNSVDLNLTKAPEVNKYTRVEFAKIYRNYKKKFSTPDNFGPVVTHPKGDFALYVQRESTSEMVRLLLYITTPDGNRKLLTIVEDVFHDDTFKKNFILQSNGVILVSARAIYFYDFLTAKKRKIFTGDTENFEQISVGAQGQFVTRVVDIWRFHDTTGASQPMDSATSTAKFFDSELWSVVGDRLFINGEEMFSLDTEVKDFQKTWFMDRTLYLASEKEVWEVVFPL